VDFFNHPFWYFHVGHGFQAYGANVIYYFRINCTKTLQNMWDNNHIVGQKWIQLWMYWEKGWKITGTFLMFKLGSRWCYSCSKADSWISCDKTENENDSWLSQQLWKTYVGWFLPSHFWIENLYNSGRKECINVVCHTFICMINIASGWKILRRTTLLIHRLL